MTLLILRSPLILYSISPGSQSTCTGLNHVSMCQHRASTNPPNNMACIPPQKKACILPSPNIGLAQPPPNKVWGVSSWFPKPRYIRDSSKQHAPGGWQRQEPGRGAAWSEVARWAGFNGGRPPKWEPCSIFCPGFCF